MAYSGSGKSNCPHNQLPAARGTRAPQRAPRLTRVSPSARQGAPCYGSGRNALCYDSTIRRRAAGSGRCCAGVLVRKLRAVRQVRTFVRSRTERGCWLNDKPDPRCGYRPSTCGSHRLPLIPFTSSQRPWPMSWNRKLSWNHKEGRGRLAEGCTHPHAEAAHSMHRPRTRNGSVWEPGE